MWHFQAFTVFHLSSVLGEPITKKLLTSSCAEVLETLLVTYRRYPLTKEGAIVVVARKTVWVTADSGAYIRPALLLRMWPMQRNVTQCVPSLVIHYDSVYKVTFSALWQCHPLFVSPKLKHDRCNLVDISWIRLFGNSGKSGKFNDIPLGVIHKLRNRG